MASLATVARATAGNARGLLVPLLLVTALSCPALAHELSPLRVTATFQKDGTYVVDLLVDLEHVPELRGPSAAHQPELRGPAALLPPPSGASPGALLRELEGATRLTFDGRPAERPKAEVATAVDGKASVTRLRLSGRTPPSVSRFTFSNGAIPGFFALTLRNEGQETAVTRWVEGGKESAPFPLDHAVVPPSRWHIVRLYLALGYTHIIPKGLDHVLFVLGIFLLAVELKPVLWQVTAFTLAHTITLALTVYGVVSLPSTVVEPLIALSIVYVAVENVFTRKRHAWRPLVVFCFGLLHGMGFAGVLSEIGLPRSEFVPALLSFNLGVEGGQLTVILLAFAAFGLPFRTRPWYRHRIVIPGSLAIAAVGLYWSIQRVFFA